MIVSRSYKLEGGSNILHDPALAFVNLVVVHRTGLEYDIVMTTPGNRECQHHVSAGQIEFLEPGAVDHSVGGAEEPITPETVFVIYSY